MGRDLILYIEEALKERVCTPEFVQQWGKIMFCHGYIATYVMDNSDDLAPQRGGAKTGQSRSRDAQRKWVAHHLVPLADAGFKRADAEARLVEHIRGIRKSGRFADDFPDAWFAAMITRGDLAATYNEKHFSIRAMRKLLLDRVDDIPPVTPLVP